MVLRRPPCQASSNQVTEQISLKIQSWAKETLITVSSAFTNQFLHNNPRPSTPQWPPTKRKLTRIFKRTTNNIIRQLWSMKKPTDKYTTELIHKTALFPLRFQKQFQKSKAPKAKTTNTSNKNWLFTITEASTKASKTWFKPPLKVSLWTAQNLNKLDYSLTASLSVKSIEKLFKTS